MITATTEGVKICVSTQFRPDLSNVQEMRYLFAYRIRIENNNDYPIQLRTRNWYIFDSLHEPQLVSGEGVVGKSPLLEPGEVYNYESYCELKSEIGYMQGFYTFLKIPGDSFQVIIPRFDLVYPFRSN